MLQAGNPAPPQRPPSRADPGRTFPREAAQGCSRASRCSREARRHLSLTPVPRPHPPAPPLAFSPPLPLPSPWVAFPCPFHEVPSLVTPSRVWGTGRRGA